MPMPMPMPGSCPVLPDGIEPRPPRVSLQRTTRNAVYRFVLREAADIRSSVLKDAPVKPAADDPTPINPAADDPAPGEPVPVEPAADVPAPVEHAAGEPVHDEFIQNEPVHDESIHNEPANTETEPGDSESSAVEPKKKSDYYSDEVADIIMGSSKKPQNKKNAKPDFKAIADQNLIVWQAIFFLCALHNFIDNASVIEMDAFIKKYISCGIGPFEKFAESIKKDRCSVENAILDRTVNNGMIEGFNNKIKLMRKIRYGRSEDELVNAFSVLSTLKNGKFRFSDFAPVKYKNWAAAS